MYVVFIALTLLPVAMDNPSVERPKSAESVSQQTDVSCAQPRGKVTFHGLPLSGPGVPQDVEKTSQELRRKDEMIHRLLADAQLYVGKIKGYQTLGQLYQESKQQSNHYKQKYEELAMKLDTVMKRLLPEVGPNVGDQDTSMTFTTAADTLYRTPAAESETIAEHPPGGHEKTERPLTIRKPADINELHKTPSSIERGLQQHRVPEESTENLDKCSTVCPKGGDGKSPSNSSASSPSFVCIGGSGLSSMDQTPVSDSMPQETTFSIGNRPTVIDESLTDALALNDLLSDPNSSADLQAMASDLLRVGSRAAKIERQARIQQVLLNELQGEKASLEQQVRVKQQKFEDIRDKYSILAEKFHQLELERNPSATISTSSLQSGEWIKVKNENEVESCQLENAASISATEVNLRNQVQNLQVQMAELEITNRSLSEGCEHCERARQQLYNRLMEIHQQSKDQEDDDLKRQQKCDEMIFSLKKRREELEFQNEESSKEQLRERHRRMKAEEQCLILRDKVSFLENRIHQLERQTPLNLMEAVGPPTFDLSAKKTEHSSPTSPTKKLLNELSILQQQVTIYKEDFDQERRDRESSQSQLAEVKLQLTQANMDLESSSQQIKLLSIDLDSAKRENLRLKEKSTQAVDELKVLKGQNRPVTQPSHHFPRQLSYGQFWTCQRCTYENPGVRATCEMCGAEAGRAIRYHTMLETEVDLLTGRGESSETPLYEQLHPGQQGGRSPQPSSIRQSPKF